jgi:dCMP deaminase
MRPTFQEIYMELAVRLAQRSTCQQKQVGCVITSEDFTRILGIGYNGNYKGGPNQCDNPNATGQSRCGCTHSETNGIAKCDNTIPNKVMFVTITPCTMCAKLIINSGFSTVYVNEKDNEYTETADLFRKTGIKLIYMGER